MMSRKLFSLITCLVLVLNFGVVPTAAEAEEGGTITGWVRDATGNPIEGIHVAACDYYDDSRCWWAFEQSSVDGRYSITGLTTGEYRVHAYSVIGGYWLGEFYDDTIDWAQALHVSVTEGLETSGINFELTQGGFISGVVKTNANVPLEDLWIQACPFDVPYSECYYPFYAWTLEDGSYILGPIPPGVYKLTVEQRDNWRTEFYDDTPYEDEVTPVTVNPGDTQSGIDFILQPGGTITGWVRDADGNPIEGIHVAACDYNDDSRCWWAFEQSPVDGSYVISGLPTGEYRVHAYSVIGGFWLDEFYNDTIDWAQALQVSVTEGSETQDINFEMTLGGAISGVVETETGEPFADLWIQACPFDDPIYECSNPFWAKTASDGSFIFVPIPTGSYRLLADPGGEWKREYYNDTPYWDQAASVNVNSEEINTGIDFILDVGGSISGTVTDEYGNLIEENIDISVCLFENDGVCWWTSVQSDGSYMVTGLPFGDYRVHAYQYPEGFWFDEYYKNTSIWEDAQPVKIKPINGKNKKDKHFNVTGIDFALELSGSISGNVITTDEEGNNVPVVGIWVDACLESVSEEMWGIYPLCKGAETDANGFYTIAQLLPGNYRVVIWGGETYAYAFYNNTRSFYEATLVPVIAADVAEDINFMLSTPVPALSAWPQDNYVEGWMWDEGSSVTLTIDDPGNGPGIDYSETQTVGLAEWNPEETYVSFNLQGIFDLQTGFSVMMTDTTYTKQHTVTELTIVNVDPDYDQISGTAVPGSHVYAGTCNDTGCINRHEIADPDGDWTADFSVPGNEPGEENTFDIVPGTGGDVNQIDADGDTTRVGWWIEEPYEPHPGFLVNLTSNEVHGWEWIAGSTVTLTIDAPGTEWTQIYSGTATPEQEGSEPWETFTWFNFPAELGVDVGYRVTLTDGSTTKEHIVTYLVALEADADADTVYGMSDPYSEVIVDSWLGANRRAIANAAGLWSVDFSVPGTEDWEQDIVDLQPGDGGGINQYDEDGDSTNINWWILNPTFSVRANNDYIEGWDWPLNATVTFTFDDPTTADDPAPITATVGVADWDPNQTWFELNLQDSIDIQVGFEVTATDGVTTKAHKVTNLSFTNIDTDRDMVYGTATPNSWISVWVCADDYCVNRDEDVDEFGSWEADFSTFGDQEWENETFDIQPGNWVDSQEQDVDGDRTMFGMNVPNPRLDVWPDANYVDAWDWAPGLPLTLTIDSLTGIDYTETQTPDYPDWDPNQTYAQFYFEGKFDLLPGDVITLENAIQSKVYTVTHIEVTGFDLDTDQVFGEASPESTVYIWVCGDTNCALRHEIAGLDGSWMADFGQLGDEPFENVTWDLIPGSSGGAGEQEDDGDSTIVDWWVPEP